MGKCDQTSIILFMYCTFSSFRDKQLKKMDPLPHYLVKFKWSIVWLYSRTELFVYNLYFLYFLYFVYTCIVLPYWRNKVDIYSCKPLVNCYINDTMFIAAQNATWVPLTLYGINGTQ